MDLLKILRSFEEFLFEATSWLIFYPLTLWRIMRRPLATMAYSDREQSTPEDSRYDDTLSPPLVLLVTIILCNLIGAAAHVPAPEGSTTATRFLVGSQQNLILFRSLVFSLVPLVAAVRLLHKQGVPIGRETLRAPFYAQCYLASPCAAFVAIGGIFFQQPDLPDAPGLVIVALGVGWFLVVQTLWYQRRLQISWPKGAVMAVTSALLAWVYLAVIMTPVLLA
jgi:hypothetical protein